MRLTHPVVLFGSFIVVAATIYASATLALQGRYNEGYRDGRVGAAVTLNSYTDDLEARIDEYDRKERTRVDEVERLRQVANTELPNLRQWFLDSHVGLTHTPDGLITDQDLTATWSSLTGIGTVCYTTDQDERLRVYFEFRDGDWRPGHVQRVERLLPPLWNPD